METDSAARLESIIEQMRAIQRAISADKQPPSMFQIDELIRLGKEYSDIVTQFDTSNDPKQA